MVLSCWRCWRAVYDADSDYEIPEPTRTGYLRLRRLGQLSLVGPGCGHGPSNGFAGRDWIYQRRLDALPCRCRLCGSDVGGEGGPMKLYPMGGR